MPDTLPFSRQDATPSAITGMGMAADDPACGITPHQTPAQSAVVQSEQQLLAKAVAGDEDAFRLLWAGAERRVLAVCLHLADHYWAAIEAVQETQVATWQNLHRFGSRSSFATWACAIARNAVRDGQRRTAARRETPYDLCQHTTAEDVGFETQLVDLMAVRDALSDLRPQFREAVVLWAIGMTYDELAVILDAPACTVRVWVHRARAQLRARMQHQ